MFGSIGGAAFGRVVRMALVAAAGLVLLATANGTASAETRTLKLYHVHLREKSEITFKRNGRYLSDGLKKLNWALRDWRESKPTNMDPALLDLLWEAYRQSGSRDYIHVIGGYRSPGTNKKLRSRSSGVAEKSLHVQGKAIDFFIPDVPLRKMRDIGLKMQVGGVGYYPRSGSPFVHFDTGRGRHWPRLSRKELAGVFPNGNTIHVPSDGKPLPGYEAAMASYKQRRAGDEIQVANASGGRSGGGRSLLAAIFGGGAEEEEDNADAAAAPTPARRTPAPARQAPEPAVQVAAVQPSPRPAAPTPRASLPTGVAMPDRVRYDTSTRTPTPAADVAGTPAAAQPAAPTEVPAGTQVAALDLARVPMPTAAPVRPATAGAPVATPAEVPVAESTLMAAVESEPAPAASSELAYAVPTPSHRPAFEAILTAAASTALPVEEAAPAGPAAVSAIAAALPVPADRLRDAAPEGGEASVEVAALEAPEPAPVEMRAAATSLSNAPRSTSEVPTGKSGRVVETRPSAAPRAEAVASQETIASRIEIASLVTSPSHVEAQARSPRPSSEMLVVSVPASPLASSFAPRAPVANSGRFTGSAGSLVPAGAAN